MPSDGVAELLRQQPIGKDLSGVRTKEIAGNSFSVLRMEEPKPKNLEKLTDHFRKQGWETMGFTTLGESSPYLIAYEKPRSLNFGATVPQEIIYPVVPFLNTIEAKGEPDMSRYMINIRGGRQGDMAEAETSLQRLAYTAKTVDDGNVVFTITLNVPLTSSVFVGSFDPGKARGN